MAPSPRPARHTVQLVSLVAEDIRAVRRAARPTDPAEPRLTPRNASLVTLSEDGQALGVRMKASLLVRLSDDEVWQAHVVLLGSFGSAVELTWDVADGFAKASCLYVLWPFARAQLDLLARLAGIAAPPQLPLIVRPRVTQIEPARSNDA